MNRKIKVLYLQHAGSLGGSSMSLLYTMQGMRDLGHTCVVALARPSSEMERLYTDAGFETIAWPGLALWDHSAGAPRPLWDPRTWMMYANLATGCRRTERNTLKLVAEIQPDLVHLNSMTFTLSAKVLAQANIPFVWHVREPPPDQGLRTRIIRSVMLRVPQLIFISDFDKQQWVGGSTGEVIHNFVDLQHFRSHADGQPLRRAYHIPADARVILYLGGVSTIKGFFVLIDALHLLKERGKRLICLMPGSELGHAQSWRGHIAGKVLPLLGTGTPRQKAAKQIAKYGLEEDLRLLPFATDIVPFFAASDVVVFPSTKPHFARPIIESIAMHKPAVGSDIGGVRELLAVHPLGRATPAGDPVALADAIQEATDNNSHSADLDSQYKSAKMLFDRHYGVNAIEAVYRRIPQLHHA